jgi:hypothetical protein
MRSEAASHKWVPRNQGAHQVKVGQTVMKCTEKKGFPVLNSLGRTKVALRTAKDGS